MVEAILNLLDYFVKFLSHDNMCNLDRESIIGLYVYSYCLNNPVSLTDSTGTNWFTDFFKGIGDTLKATFTNFGKKISMGWESSKNSIVSTWNDFKESFWNSSIGSTITDIADFSKSGRWNIYFKDMKDYFTGLGDSIKNLYNNLSIDLSRNYANSDFYNGFSN